MFLLDAEGLAAAVGSVSVPALAAIDLDEAGDGIAAQKPYDALETVEVR